MSKHTPYKDEDFIAFETEGFDELCPEAQAEKMMEPDTVRKADTCAGLLFCGTQDRDFKIFLVGVFAGASIDGGATYSSIADYLVDSYVTALDNSMFDFEIGPDLERHLNEI